MAQTRSFCNKSIVHVPLHVELSIEVKAKCYQTKYETEQRLYMFSHRQLPTPINCCVVHNFHASTDIWPVY